VSWYRLLLRAVWGHCDGDVNPGFDVVGHAFLKQLADFDFAPILEVGFEAMHFGGRMATSVVAERTRKPIGKKDEMCDSMNNQEFADTNAEYVDIAEDECNFPLERLWGGRLRESRCNGFGIETDH